MAGLAAGVPVLCLAAAVYSNGDGSWPSLLLIRASVADALLYSAVCVMFLAPLCGVSMASLTKTRQPANTLAAAIGTTWPLAASVTALVATSAIVVFLTSGAPGSALGFVVSSHLTLAAVALALAMMGALIGMLAKDPLDAAGVSLALTVVAGIGVLVAGGAIADVPRGALNVALTASPLVTMVSAANIDLVRMDPLYSISPLAGLRIDYPTWYVAAACYLLAAVAGFAGLTFTSGAPRGVRIPRGVS